MCMSYVQHAFVQQMIYCLLYSNAHPEWMGCAGQKSVTSVLVTLLSHFFPFLFSVVAIGKCL